VIHRISNSSKTSLRFFKIVLGQRFNLQPCIPTLLFSLNIKDSIAPKNMRKPCFVQCWSGKPHARSRSHRWWTNRPTSLGRNHTSPNDIIVAGMGMSALARSQAGGLCRGNRFVVKMFKFVYSIVLNNADHPCHVDCVFWTNYYWQSMARTCI